VDPVPDPLLYNVCINVLIFVAVLALVIMVASLVVVIT
jgi:hypothetical protein